MVRQPNIIKKESGTYEKFIHRKFSTYNVGMQVLYSICTKIQAAVDRAIRNNKALRLSIQEQSQSVINDYVQECIRQTRLMFD